MGGGGGSVGKGVLGCWEKAPEKIEHGLNGRKHIVQLAKDPTSPPPSPASKIEWSDPKVPFTLFQNGFRSFFRSIHFIAIAFSFKSFKLSRFCHIDHC